MSTKPKRIQVLTPRARLSFPALDKPRVMEEGKTPTYQATLLFDKEAQATKEFKQLRRIVEQAIKDKWGDKPPKRLKRPFLTVEDLNNVPDGYEDDHVIVRMNSTIQPGLVDGRNQELIGGQIAEELYAGCYVRAATHAYAWNHPTGGPGVSLSLNHLQKMGEGEPFVARTKATDVFEAVLDDDDDDLDSFMDDDDDEPF